MRKHALEDVARAAEEYLRCSTFDPEGSAAADAEENLSKALARLRRSEHGQMAAKPVPGGDATAAEESARRYRNGLERLASREAFNAAVDLDWTSQDVRYRAIADELIARLNYAADVLGHVQPRVSVDE